MRKKILIFTRGAFLFVFSCNPGNPLKTTVLRPLQKWVPVLDSDAAEFGGFSRNDTDVEHFTQYKEGRNQLSLYIPCRSALVLRCDD